MNKKIYKAPVLRVVEFQAESGYAASRIRSTFRKTDDSDPFSHEGFWEFRGHEGFTDNGGDPNDGDWEDMGVL